jgi:hypothetical protein
MASTLLKLVKARNDTDFDFLSRNILQPDEKSDGQFKIDSWD